MLLEELLDFLWGQVLSCWLAPLKNNIPIKTHY